MIEAIDLVIEPGNTVIAQGERVRLYESMGYYRYQGGCGTYRMVKPSNIFTRNGNNVESTLEVDVFDLLLGAKKTIKDLDNNDVEIELEAGTQPDKIITRVGKGISSVNNRNIKGNHYIKLKV